jgi:hypothetical protein
MLNKLWQWTALLIAFIATIFDRSIPWEVKEDEKRKPEEQ